jgi:CheY-specific phosphatase CheX
MTPLAFALQATVRSVAHRTREHFAQGLSLALGQERVVDRGLDELRLRDLTAIIGLGGAVSALVAFSVDLGLAQEIRRIETVGFKLNEPDLPLYLHDAMAEVANVVLGHSTADLSSLGGVVTLSTPVVIESPRLLGRPDQTLFSQIAFNTPYGGLDIACIAPRERFDARLNPLPAKKEMP